MTTILLLQAIKFSFLGCPTFETILRPRKKKKNMYLKYLSIANEFGFEFPFEMNYAENFISIISVSFTADTAVYRLSLPEIRYFLPSVETLANLIESKGFFHSQLQCCCCCRKRKGTVCSYILYTILYCIYIYTWLLQLGVIHFIIPG